MAAVVLADRQQDQGVVSGVKSLPQNEAVVMRAKWRQLAKHRSLRIPVNIVRKRFTFLYALK